MSVNAPISVPNLRVLLQLMRLPNVLIIILTQLLLRYCVIEPNLYSESREAISPITDFLILILVTVLIAVGGYVINDYFDVKIDRINRPERMVINKLISGHTAIKLHIILNGIAMVLGFYLAWRIKAISFGLVFPFISGRKDHGKVEVQGGDLPAANARVGETVNRNTGEARDLLNDGRIVITPSATK